MRRYINFFVFVFLALIFSLQGCAVLELMYRPRYYSVPPPSPPADVVNTYEGVASWYGEDFHGRKTANGEIFDMYELTAAHKTLPMGTTCVVTNLDNDKTVTVRINDRGPFVKDRIIDLSYAAAKVIGMIDTGTAPVRVEVLGDGSPPHGEELPKETTTPAYDDAVLFYTIQIGSFTERVNAESLSNELSTSFNDVFIEEFKTSETTYYRVRVGSFPSRDDALKTAADLSQQGYDGYITER